MNTRAMFLPSPHAPQPRVSVLRNQGTWDKLRYSAGIGGSYLHYRQQAHSYDYWSFCPKAALNYNFTHSLQLSYNFQLNERTSRVAMISDAAIRTNRMEWTVGSQTSSPTGRRITPSGCRTTTPACKPMRKASTRNVLTPTWRCTNARPTTGSSIPSATRKRLTPCTPWPMQATG